MTKYIVETTYNFQEFDEYRDAEIYCGENNIPCDCIYEEEYAENRYEKLMNGIIRKFGFEAKKISLCDLMERPICEIGAGSEVTLDVANFEIVTLLAER